jgi:hypothetical protein
MKALLTGLIGICLGATMSCGAPVTAGSAPAPSQDPAIHFSNKVGTAVNVYVVSGGVEIFLRQVAPNSSEILRVRGVGVGTLVDLKATSGDGFRTWRRNGVTLESVTVWQVP